MISTDLMIAFVHPVRNFSQFLVEKDLLSETQDSEH